jgi:polyhydroxybutyrate depolymerase
MVRHLLTCLSLAAVVAGCSAASEYTLAQGGQDRTYRLHVPAGLQKPAPLIIALHGGGGSGKVMERATGLSALADSRGFVVVYPDALEGHWNDGRNARTIDEQVDDVDDVGFVVTLVGELVSQGLVDPYRVFVTGISNGAILSHRLACEHSELFAAAAPVVGAMAAPVLERCRPASPMSWLIINGTEDKFIKYEGGTVYNDDDRRGRTASVDATVAKWRAANACDAEETMSVIDAVPDDGTAVHVSEWRCTDARIVLHRIEGGGHTWPSGAELMGLLGRATEEYDSTLIVDFFLADR